MLRKPGAASTLSTLNGSNAPRRVLLVGGGSELQPRLRALFPQARTVALCRAATLRWVHELHENVAVVVLNDSSSRQVWVTAARHINEEFPIDTVVSLAEIDQDKAAAIAHDLGVPFHTPAVIERVHDKKVMRACLAASGIEQVPHRMVSSVEDALRFFDDVGPPIILKPSRGRASAGVTVATSRAEVPEAYERAADASAPRLEPSPPLAERFVAGPEYSLECVSHNGRHHVLAVVEKFKDEQTKVELGHLIPARIDDMAERLLVDHVRVCLSALGIRDGITHTEVILGQDGPFLVETHLRQAGDEIPQLVQDATSLDYGDLLIQAAMGEDIGRMPELSARAGRPRYTGAAAIRFLAPPACGVLEKVDGWSEVQDIEGVQDCQQTVDDGTALAGLTSSYARLGHVRVRAGSPDEAISLADRAVAILEVRHRPPDAVSI